MNFYNRTSMNIIKQISAALVLYLGFAYIAQAKPLTAQQVEQFIVSMPELTAIGEKHNKNKHHNIDPSQPLSSSLKQMDRQGPEYADLTQLASRHGFSSVEQWADIGDRTIKAYLIATSGLSRDAVEAGYQQGITNINKDPALNAAQKEAILTRMAKSHQRNMDARQASEQDLPAVRPHMTVLDSLFD